jgi:Domain of unknown function (DUF4333)
MTRRRAFVLVALPAALALSACGTKVLNTGKLETSIKQGIEQQAGLRVKSVGCPNKVKIKAGDTFNCTAVTTGGDRATVRVVQQDDEGHVRYQVGS